MPYISRNEIGDIVALQNSTAEEDAEWLDAGDPEVLLFIKGGATSEQAKQALTSSDNEMVRVVEDLVDLLMEKQVFIFTELPEAVQLKLNARRKLRQDINALEGLINEDDSIF